MLLASFYKTGMIELRNKTDFISNCQGVSKAILDKAGPNVETECQQIGEKNVSISKLKYLIRIK